MKPNHGAIRTLNTEECISLLGSNYFGHLGCHSKDEIYLVPITYVFDEDYLYCHSTAGKKIEMMKENPRICIQTEEVQDFFHWKSVIAYGEYEELKEHQSAMAMRLLISKLGGLAPKHSSLEIDFAAQLERSILFRMKIDKITGKFEGIFE